MRLRWIGLGLLGAVLVAACGTDGGNSTTFTEPNELDSGVAPPEGPSFVPDTGTEAGFAGSGACTRTCADLSVSCGPTGDGCGNLIQCGTCTAPDTCGGGGKASVCGGTETCKPKTCAEFPSGS